MTVEQIVEIPANRRIALEVPREVPAGQARVIIQFPVADEASTAVPQEEKGQSSSEAFREAIRRVQGVWKDNPWTDHLEDIRTMRDEWDHRDPWNPDPEKRHRD